MDHANITNERWDFLTSFLNSSNTAIVVTTTACDDYSIVYANPAFEKLTGYSAQEIHGKNCRFLQDTDRSQPQRASIRSALAAGESCQCVIRNYTKDGRAFWNRIYIFPVSVNGHVSNFASIQYDASEEKALLEGIEAGSQYRDRLIQELHKRRVKMERLSVDLINALETERQAFARELHDELGQHLSTLMMLLHRARPSFALVNEETLLSEAESEVSHLLRLVRNMSASLRPPSLDLFGLEESIRELLRRQLHNTSAWSFDFSYTGPRLLPAIEVSIYRIIQESVTNIIRHAKASHVVIKVNTRRKGSELKLIILDNGVGFVSKSWYEHNSIARKFGLVGISERVQLLGGAYRIISKPKHGTRVEVVLPIRFQTPA